MVWLRTKPKLAQTFAHSLCLSSLRARAHSYVRAACCCQEYHGDTQSGRRLAEASLAWHLGFLCQYRQSSSCGAAAEGGAEGRRDIEPLEALLRCRDERIHMKMVDVLMHAQSDAQALRVMRLLAREWVQVRPKKPMRERALCSYCLPCR